MDTTLKTSQKQRHRPRAGNFFFSQIKRLKAILVKANPEYRGKYQLTSEWWKQTAVGCYISTV